jgi:hypothetical protein
VPEIRASHMRILLIGVLAWLSCSPSQAADQEFPQQVRGFWADTTETCDVLKERSPAGLRRGQRWLKLTATAVMGTTQWRFLREKVPVQMAGADPVRFLFEVQMPDSFGLIGELSFVGKKDLFLRETVVGARNFRSYLKC